MRLLFVGDVFPIMALNEALNYYPPSYPWGNTLPLFESADLRCCNLECAITDRTIRWSGAPKLFYFRSDAKNSAVLSAAHMDAVSLANNHSLDFGNEGLFEAMENMKNSRVPYMGAGRDISEASRPLSFEVLDQKIGIIACTDNEPVSWEATEKTPGVFYVPLDVHDQRAEKLCALIRREKRVCDFLIVSIHWGDNWGYLPPEEHVAFGHALIDAGADILFGHSCHVIRGVEIYKQKPIMYSTGIIVDGFTGDEVGKSDDERCDQSFIFVVEADTSGLHRLLLYPTIIQNYQTNLARGGECADLLTRTQALCAQMQTIAVWNDEQGYLEIQIA